VNSSDILLVLLTLLLLPGMVALAFTFLSGAMERNEHVKYAALVGEPDGDHAAEEGRGWGS